MFKKKIKGGTLTREQALSCTPVQNNVVSSITLDSGLIQIEYTMILKPLLNSIFKRFSVDQTSRPTRKIQLDEIGSSVWQMIDGQTSTADIIRKFSSAHAISLQEAEQSITTFLRELGKRGLIGFS